jgi:hypothetical protein
MSDTEQKTPNKTGASGAAWSDAEKVNALVLHFNPTAHYYTDCLPHHPQRRRRQCRRQDQGSSLSPPSFSICTSNNLQDAPVPFGRSLVSCKKLLYRLKEKHKDDIEKIRASQPLTATAAPAADGDKPEKPKTPRKRKSKVDVEGEAEESPKKKATPRKKKGAAVPVKEEESKEEVKEENGEDAMEV